MTSSDKKNLTDFKVFVWFKMRNLNTNNVPKAEVFCTKKKKKDLQFNNTLDLVK